MSKKEVQLAISLFEAIDDINLSNVIVLLEKYRANPNTIIPKLGISPLHYATGFEDLSFAENLIEIFLKKDADPNLLSECDNKLTPLHIACIWNRPKIVKMLLERGGNLELKCNEGQTCIQYAVVEENLEVLEVIKKFVFEQKIEKKKNEILQAQRGPLENLSTPKRNYEVTSPRTPKTNPTVQSLQSPATPIKNTLTNALQRIEKEKFTPNRINYNFDVTSPYYINITHRRHKSSRTIEMDENEENERKLEKEVEEVCNEKKNLFELTQKNLKEFSKQMRKAIIIERIAIHKRRSYIMEWREKIQQIRKDEETVDMSYLDYLKECNNVSSTDEEGIIEMRSSSESYQTAKSDLNRCDNAISNDAFIEHTAECVENIFEYSDVENGIVLYERKVRNFQNDCESSLSTVVSIPPLDYDTDTLKTELKSFGRNPGPITKSTKRIYLKQLMKFKKHPERLGIVQEESSSITYPLELQKTVTNYNHLTENIKEYLTLETRMVNYFLEKAHLKWREGNSKTSFVYLLLDPRVTENLPVIHNELTKQEVWEKFINSIFYVGKGKRSRPYQHLYDAIKIYSNGSSHDSKTSESKKISKIIDIWKSNHGVVCLHMFHSIMPAEAFTREAALIETLGIHNLSNMKKGEYYGAATCFTMRQKRQLGVALLHRALNIYLAEGESQLKCSDF